MSHPIETANIVLILLGVLLLLSGPYISYRTVRAIREGNKQHISNALNFVIAILFTAAGYLFIVNNLRGNPLALA